MTSVLVRYNKSRAVGALVLPLIAIGLMFGPDMASGFALSSYRDLIADGIMLFAVIWWIYSLVPGAIATLGYKFNDLSFEHDSLRLPEGQEVIPSNVDRVFVETHFLRHPVVTILTAGRTYTVATAFQAFGQRRSADQIIEQILELRRSSRIVANSSYPPIPASTPH